MLLREPHDKLVPVQDEDISVSEVCVGVRTSMALFVLPLRPQETTSTSVSTSFISHMCVCACACVDECISVCVCVHECVCAMVRSVRAGGQSSSSVQQSDGLQIEMVSEPVGIKLGCVGSLMMLWTFLRHRFK